MAVQPDAFRTDEFDELHVTMAMIDDGYGFTAALSDGKTYGLAVKCERGVVLSNDVMRAVRRAFVMRQQLIDHPELHLPVEQE